MVERTKGVFVSMGEEGGGVFCVCFNGFEGGRVDGREGGGMLFFILHKLKRFMRI